MSPLEWVFLNQVQEQRGIRQDNVNEQSNNSPRDDNQAADILENSNPRLLDSRRT